MHMKSGSTEVVGATFTWKRTRRRRETYLVVWLSVREAVASVDKLKVL